MDADRETAQTALGLILKKKKPSTVKIIKLSLGFNAVHSANRAWLHSRLKP